MDRLRYIQLKARIFSFIIRWSYIIGPLVFFISINFPIIYLDPVNFPPPASSIEKISGKLDLTLFDGKRGTMIEINDLLFTCALTATMRNDCLPSETLHAIAGKAAQVHWVYVQVAPGIKHRVILDLVVENKVLIALDDTERSLANAKKSAVINFKISTFFAFLLAVFYYGKSTRLTAAEDK